MKTILKSGVVSLLGLTLFMSFNIEVNNKGFYKKLQEYTNTLPGEFNQIDKERKQDLEELSNYILEQRIQHRTTNLLFICTSNSRRSHMAQIWAKTAALYYGIDSLWTFSGGTEATKVNMNAINALKRCGFSLTTNNIGDNPVWNVNTGNKSEGWMIFSKKYSHSSNPKKEFGAIMVCSEADKSCPTVDGADARIPLPYEDPKYFDNTPSQDLKYDERCRQIARDMFFVMDYVKTKLVLKAESSKK
jgi:arsenate reductase